MVGQIWGPRRLPCLMSVDTHTKRQSFPEPGHLLSFERNRQYLGARKDINDTPHPKRFCRVRLQNGEVCGYGGIESILKVLKGRIPFRPADSSTDTEILAAVARCGKL